VIVGHTPDALFESLTAKVHEQPEGLLGETEVGQQLSGMDRSQPVHRFDLDDQPPVDKKVGAKAFSQSHPVELDLDRLLPPTPSPARTRLAAIKAS
jgi:hypothetical protein